jgi:hypothetical protein
MTERDEQQATAREAVIEAAQDVVREGDHAWREHAEDTLALGTHMQYYVMPAIFRLRRMLEALAATDGTTRE